MLDAVGAAVFNYLTLVTVVVALFVPSIWTAAATGMTVAMIGIVALVHADPGSWVVAAWIIGQVGTAIAANLMRRTII